MARAWWLSDLMEGQSAHREWVQEKEETVGVPQAMNGGLLMRRRECSFRPEQQAYLMRNSQCEAGADRVCAVAS